MSGSRTSPVPQGLGGEHTSGALALSREPFAERRRLLMGVLFHNC